jgi:hypothetical protein
MRAAAAAVVRAAEAAVLEVADAVMAVAEAVADSVGTAVASTGLFAAGAGAVVVEVVGLSGATGEVEDAVEQVMLATFAGSEAAAELLVEITRYRRGFSGPRLTQIVPG